jgi:hypothetical protein
MLCEYGCGKEANFTLSNGKVCCSLNRRVCPTFTKNALIAASRKVECEFCKKQYAISVITKHKLTCYFNPINIKHCPKCDKIIESRINIYCSSRCSAIGNKNRNKNVIHKEKVDYIKEKIKYIKQNFPYEQLPYKLRFEILIEKYGYKCSDPKCKMDLTRVDERGKLPLDIHHIDGNNDNHKFENEILICFNCHFYTGNYRNKGKHLSVESKKKMVETRRIRNSLSNRGLFHRIKLQDILKSSTISQSPIITSP